MFLGYGSPEAAYYKNLRPADQVEDMTYQGTFVDSEHIRSSFPSADISFCGEETSLKKPFRLKITPSSSGSETIIVSSDSNNSDGNDSGERPDKIRFTPSQVEAIRAGMNTGLSLVVGPPGTGKTDVAVQIITNLYHNHHNQKIVVIAHSNAALNDIFEKIRKNVDPRHLIRLGSGEKELVSLEDYSKQGRVDYSLGKRLQLLEQVQQLAVSLKVSVIFFTINPKHYKSNQWTCFIL